MIILMAGNQAAAPKSGTEQIMSFVPFILIFVVMWFFMIRPQSKKQKEMAAMLDSVKAGDTVLTNGGIIGKVTSLKPDKNIVVVEIDPTNHVRVDFQKSAIVTIINKDVQA